MKILIIGSGGREYSIGKSLKKDNQNIALFFSPGNGGTQDLGENVQLTAINDIVNFAKTNNIYLTIVGPEMPLMEGIVDAFQENQLPIIGPDKKSAQLESSKAFAKNFMKKYKISTAEYMSFQHYVDARDYINENKKYPIVIKASGLAEGKGVLICQDELEAHDALKKMMLDKNFGEAGNEVVIEEFLDGFEVSILSFFDGERIYPMISAMDHKKIGERETGLNTGGMGVVAPHPLFNKEINTLFENKILKPTLNGLINERLDFKGIIFFGLMVTSQDIYLLEYNMRFGDPETQTILPLLENNLLNVFEQLLKKEPISLVWKKEVSTSVVMASGGYPLNYDKDYEIIGLERLTKDDFNLAGVRKNDNKYYTNGGRVLSIHAIEDTLENSLKSVYEKIDKVSFAYNYYRKDIGTIYKK